MRRVFAQSDSKPFGTASERWFGGCLGGCLGSCFASCLASSASLLSWGHWERLIVTPGTFAIHDGVRLLSLRGRGHIGRNTGIISQLLVLTRVLRPE